MSKLAYTIEQAAEVSSFSASTVMRAIKATDPHSFPPPLKAKRIGTDRKPGYRILAGDLQSWLNSMKDA